MSLPDLPPLHYGPRRFLHAEAERLRARRYARLRLRPLAPTIGAEVEGVDLAKLDDETFAELRQAWLDWKVLFFRDQDLTTAQQLAFAGRFGPLEEHPFLTAKDGYGQVVRFEKDEQTVGVENNWHSDVSWREVPSLGSVLRAVEVPAWGGDTLFADMTAAWQGLPEPLQAFLDGRRAVHDFSHSFGMLMDAAKRAEQQRRYPPVAHPIARRHPDTGARILYVNVIFTSHVEGLPREESDRLLAWLYRQASVPEYQCRFSWTPGAVAFWDNRAVQHYAASDYWPARRVMERATIIGERPL